MRVRLRRSLEDRIPDSALADVAFLLLIFFLATTVIAEERGIPLLLPAQGTDGSPVNPANVMRLSTDASGTILYVDRLPTAPGEIRERIREAQAGNPRLILLVDPHRKAPYRAMVDLLDEAKLAEAERISVKTRR
jgi:biopolymer transport protein ExbD